MKLSDITANEDEFMRKFRLCSEQSSETVDVNDGCKSADEFTQRLNEDPVTTDWTPLYDAAGKFD